mmetsp:Transcript_5563/g.18059  ORF Transcript_5563/g.18059 Transcript_5563/m.18059 type:complete len:201 (+) Transcript_5563:1-603(+)
MPESSVATPSAFTRCATICASSSAEYGFVVTIITLSNMSEGMPCGDSVPSAAPMTWHTPRLVANTRIGASGDSMARLRKEKHLTSNMCTSSMKRTPGTTSAMPCSTYLLTSSFTLDRSLAVISVRRGTPICPMSESMSCPPCGVALAASKSCIVTSCTTSLFLCTSPLGSGTYSSASRSNSVAKASHRPTRFTAPELAST